jgi:FAD/FMN-containing dehydrogenase
MNQPADFIEQLKALLGPGCYLDQPFDLEPFTRDWRGRMGATSFVALPRTTEDVATIIALANHASVPLVTQGGHTGLVKGALPQDEIILSTQRLDKIRETNPDSDFIIAEAGVILTQVHKAAQQADRLFPLSLASEASATIGGLISTNAGGVAVLRYGMMRDLVFGLEVVLPDGRIWNGLRTLRKDNTGYDLKQLFMGAEGTLGVVTAAALKLFPRPAARVTAICALTDLDAAVKLLPIAKKLSGDAVTGFELIGRFGLELVLEHIPNSRAPFAVLPEWTLLMDMSFGREDGATATMEAVLAEAVSQGLLEDAIIAQSETQANAFWHLRENVSAAEKKIARGIHHDISAPAGAVPDLIRKATEAAAQLAPGARIVAFGHAGDGNIHFTVKPSASGGASQADLLARHDEIQHAVHRVAVSLGGSISAEHGIGALKRDEMPLYKSPLEIEMMQTLKRTFDPKNLLNPGRVVKI